MAMKRDNRVQGIYRAATQTPEWLKNLKLKLTLTCTSVGRDALYLRGPKLIRMWSSYQSSEAFKLYSASLGAGRAGRETQSAQLICM